MDHETLVLGLKDSEATLLRWALGYFTDQMPSGHEWTPAERELHEKCGRFLDRRNISIQVGRHPDFGQVLRAVLASNVQLGPDAIWMERVAGRLADEAARGNMDAMDMVLRVLGYGPS